MKSWDYPLPERKEHYDSYHGEKVLDEYAWMEDGKNPEVLDWVKRENDFTAQFFTQFGDRLENEIKQLKNMPKKTEYGGYSEISIAGEVLACKKVDSEGHESIVRISPEFKEIEVLLDVDEIDPAVHLAGVKLNPVMTDIAAIFLLYPGADRPSVLVYNWKTKESIARLDESFSYAWSKNGQVIYYASVEIDKVNQVNYNNIIAYNIVTKEEKVLYTYPENSVLINVDLSDDGETLFGEVWINYHDIELLKMDVYTGEYVSLTGKKRNSYHYVGTLDKKHYILTDEDAERGKIIAFDEKDSSLENAQVIIPQMDNSILMGAAVAGDKLVVIRMQDVNEILGIFDKDGALMASPDAPCTYGSYFGGAKGRLGNVWKEKNKMFVPYESFSVPKSMMELNLEDYILREVYRTVEESNPDIVVEQKFAVSKDGTRIPAFLVYKKDTVFDGSVKTLMYGYGGYNAVETPAYECPYIGKVADWVKEGNLYVLCILRGGGEYGAAWHEQGYKDKKKNCYYDFIAITEMIQSQGYTNPSKTAIIGGSNGGLLVTALLTMRPDLYQAVIASVPHTDMLHFKNDDRGPMYTTEYGDIADETMYHYIKSYSPYHNVKEAVQYPAVYIQTGECDNNVPPYHGKKMAARLQGVKASKMPTLLRVLPKGSHDVGVGEDHYLTIAERKIFLDWALEQEDKN